MEQRVYTRKEKQSIVNSLESSQHNYTSFFVCRNPVDKLLSVYNYLMDARVSRLKHYLLSSLIQAIESPMVMKVSGRSEWAGQKVPSWLQYLQMVANSKQKNYLGLLLPLYLGCDPCKLNYDAVIRMETFNADTRYRYSACTLLSLSD